METIAKNRTCENFFHCTNSSQCIHLNYVCDDKTDCRYGDDEKLCSVSRNICPSGCECIHLAIACTCMPLMTVKDIYSVFYHMMFASIKKTPLFNSISKLYFPDKARIYIYSGNYLKRTSIILPEYQSTILPMVVR